MLCDDDGKPFSQRVQFDSVAKDISFGPGSDILVNERQQFHLLRMSDVNMQKLRDMAQDADSRGEYQVGFASKLWTVFLVLE